LRLPQGRSEDFCQSPVKDISHCHEKKVTSWEIGIMGIVQRI